MDRIKTLTLLRYVASGKSIEAIPRTIIIDEHITVETWIDVLRTALLPRARRRIQSSKRRYKIPLRAQGMSNRLAVAFGTYQDELYWLLLDNNVISGVGHLTLNRDGEYATKAAAIFNGSLRGKRIYPLILRTIRTELRTNIYSDSRFIGLGAVRAWKRMGLFDQGRNRFKLQRRDNPGRGIQFTTGPLTYDDLRAVLTRLATEPLG